MIETGRFFGENKVVNFSDWLHFQKLSALNLLLWRPAVVGMWLQNCKRRHFVEKESD